MRKILKYIRKLRRKVWQYVQTHPPIKRFVFDHCRIWYTKLRYFIVFGKELDISHPKSFHEKLFWLSVCYRHPLIVQCADKYRVRKYVESVGCGDILNTLYGVYDSAEQIPFYDLPDEFAIKSNRSSGDNFFCKDKGCLDIPKTIGMLNAWKNHEYGLDTAEYQYDKISFKLCCEKYLRNDESQNMIEYQFFCFNGKPTSILVRNDLETPGKEPFAISYSMDWEREYLRDNEEQFLITLPKPKVFDKMVDYATKLCMPFPHVRVDFYVINGEELYFGELTFSTAGNVLSNYKDSTLELWNQSFTLPERYTYKDRY